jgi:DNA-binding NarL/FixJ family response regulator
MIWDLAKHPLQGAGGSQRAAVAVMPQQREALTRATMEARTALEEAVVAAAAAAQRTRSLTAVLEEALAELPVVEGAPGVPTTHIVQAKRQVDSLSPREQEVLALVAEGHSNKAIADALYVSPKLHADSRVQLAVIAARQLCGRTTWPNGSGPA